MRRPYSSYIGEKFGLLSIIDYLKIGKGFFTCKCDCGNVKEVRCDHVLGGRTISCGCQANKECFRDLTGLKFNKLSVLKIAYKNVYTVYWLCKCDCGNTTIVNSHNLVSGNTKSCGCYMKERIKKTNTIHGFTKSRLYSVYLGMKQRCYNKKSPAYKSYGGRGVKICDEWLSKATGFVAFKNWALKNGYTENLSIDRIDVNGNYEPSNCRWTNELVQANNKRTNRFIIYKGERKTMAEWSRIFGISYSAIQYRLSKHKPLEEVFKINSKEAL